MKKIILLLCIISLGFSAIRLQGQAAVLGYGLGLGLGARVIPELLEMGIEGSTHAWPAIETKGTYQGIPYSGEVGFSVTRAGGYAKLTIPGLNLVPFLGAFAYPTLHAGTQSGLVSVEGNVHMEGAYMNTGKRQLQGSYVLLGFPSYLGPFFIEPAFGTQHIAMPGGFNRSFADAQIAIGLQL